MIRCTCASAATNSDFHAAPLQLSAHTGEQRHRAAVDALHGGHLEVERLTARCAGLEPAQLGPEGRCLGEPQAAADADLALIGAGLHLLDCECRRHRDDLARDMVLPAWRAESETKLTSRPEGDLALARFSKHGPCHGRRRWKSARCLSGHPAGERKRVFASGRRAFGSTFTLRPRGDDPASVQAAPEQVIGRAIGSAHVVLFRVEIDAEDSLEIAARTAGPFAPLATHDVHSVLVAEVHDQLRHSPIELAVRHASAPFLGFACCGWISAPDARTSVDTQGPLEGAGYFHGGA